LPNNFGFDDWLLLLARDQGPDGPCGPPVGASPGGESNWKFGSGGSSNRGRWRRCRIRSRYRSHAASRRPPWPRKNASTRTTAIRERN